MTADLDYATELRWFLDQVTGRDGGLAPGPASERLLPSPTLDADGRLDIYRRSYHARLAAALAADYPTARTLLGDSAFGDLAAAYVAAHPPSSWTLDDLGRSLPSFLDRPVRAAAPAGPCCGHDEAGAMAWPLSVADRRLLRDVARLEWAMARVFAAPVRAPMPVETLATVGLERLASSGLVVQPGLRLLSLGHRANAMVTASLQGLDLPDRAPCPTFVAVYRVGHHVYRQDLSASQHRLLSALARQETVAQAIESAAGAWTGAPVALGAALQAWFTSWAADGLFVRLR